MADPGRRALGEPRYQTIDAVVEEDGTVRLLAPVRLTGARRAIVTILDEPADAQPGSNAARAAAPAPSDWTSRYQLVHALGRGGMGETFLARDNQTGRAVCIKTLLPSVDARALSQECRALARLNHDGIVRLLDFDLDSASRYFVMEYVPGSNLARYLGRHRVVGEPLAVRLGRQLFEALAYAHREEIIHCDLKPSNVVLALSGSEIVAKILDFGLAVVDRLDDQGAVTAVGRIAGTPSYMAPEQVQGEILSGTCDVYAAGQIMWEMLMGRPAFATGGRSPVSVMHEKVCMPGGLEIRDAPLDVSEAVSTLIRQCTHPVPARRPTAAECAERLAALDSAIVAPVLPAPINLDIGRADAGGRPSGWFDSRGFVGGASSSYDVRVVPHDDAPSARCVRLHGEGVDPRSFGSLMQRCPARHLAGRDVRLEIEIRTSDLSGWGGAWLRADDENTALLFDNMHDRPIRGSTGWTRYVLSARLPAGTVWLNYGVLLAGPGTLWAGRVHVSVQDTRGTCEDGFPN
jgi:serine/threonine protein kinase